MSEAWERRTDEPDIRSVDAGYLRPYGQWQVGVAVMEFVREATRRMKACVAGSKPRWSVAGATGCAKTLRRGSSAVAHRQGARGVWLASSTSEPTSFDVVRAPRLKRDRLGIGTPEPTARGICRGQFV